MPPVPSPPSRPLPRRVSRRVARRLSSTLLVLLMVALGVPAGAAGAAEAPGAGEVDAEQPRGEWPLRPRPDVVERFDPPDSAYGAGHRGVDLAGSVTQPVLSALPGRVSYAGRLAGRGMVTVTHGATRTTYQPVTASVAVGDELAAGERLGTLELAGSHCFPRACLHWGWIRGETYLDPLLLVGGGPVRLLPQWRDLPVRGAGSSPRTAAGWPGPLRVPRPALPYGDWLAQALG